MASTEEKLLTLLLSAEHLAALARHFKQISLRARLGQNQVAAAHQVELVLGLNAALR